MATSSSVKVPIFIDTNLETHIAMAVSPQITAGDLKRDFRREHSICFPSLGEIRITGLMVKRKSFFYHLPDSMVIKNVFQGLKGIWFIRMDADLVKKSNYTSLSEGVAEIRGSDVNLSNVTEAQTHENHINDIDKNSTENTSRKMKKKRTVRLEGLMEELLVPVSIGKKKKRKKRRIKEKCFNQEVVDEGKNKILPTTEEEPVISSRKHFCNVDTTKEPNLREEQISPPTVGISTVSSSGIVSVTGIITRYFSEFDEVKSLNDHPGCDIGDELQSCIASQGHQDKSSKTVKAEQCRQPPEPHTLLSAKTLTRMLSHPLPADLSPETSRKEFSRTEVGKRLVLAANDLKISNSNKKSSTNICHSRGGMFSPSVVRTLVFEVTDSDG